MTDHLYLTLFDFASGPAKALIVPILISAITQGVKHVQGLDGHHHHKAIIRSFSATLAISAAILTSESGSQEQTDSVMQLANILTEGAIYWIQAAGIWAVSKRSKER